MPLSTLAGGTSPSLIEQVVSAAERITGKRVRRGKETNAILLSLPQAGWAVTEKLTPNLIKTVNESLPAQSEGDEREKGRSRGLFKVESRGPAQSRAARDRLPVREVDQIGDGEMTRHSARQCRPPLRPLRQERVAILADEAGDDLGNDRAADRSEMLAVPYYLRLTQDVEPERRVAVKAAGMIGQQFATRLLPVGILAVEQLFVRQRLHFHVPGDRLARRQSEAPAAQRFKAASALRILIGSL